MSSNDPLALGMIGCGGFGLFCLDAFSRIQGVRIVAVADSHAPAARQASEKLGISPCKDAAELIARKDVDIVHVATPPSGHHELALAAIKAGKHVLCEKPLAMDLAQADEILAAADRAGVIAPVNFVLRYNQVVDAAKAIVDSRLLGRVLAGFLTNCAFDTLMPPGHWFWDKSVSGGIFIEHGVHFFDLYAHWLGPGQVVAARTEMREGTSQEDRVMCTMRHDGALVSHYHGFDQIKPMDRADHRLVCELGDIRVQGWIPLAVTVDAAVDDAAAEQLARCCRGCEVKTVETFDAEHQKMSGRGQSRKVTRRINLRYCPNSDKQAVYADSIRALLADQIAFIRDRSHTRRVVESNGREALAIAVACAAGESKIV